MKREWKDEIILRGKWHVLDENSIRQQWHMSAYTPEDCGKGKLKDYSIFDEKKHIPVVVKHPTTARPTNPFSRTTIHAVRTVGKTAVAKRCFGTHQRMQGQEI